MTLAGRFEGFAKTNVVLMDQVSAPPLATCGSREDDTGREGARTGIVATSEPVSRSATPATGAVLETATAPSNSAGMPGNSSSTNFDSRDWVFNEWARVSTKPPAVFSRLA